MQAYQELAGPCLEKEEYTVFSQAHLISTGLLAKGLNSSCTSPHSQSPLLGFKRATPVSAVSPQEVSREGSRVESGRLNSFLWVQGQSPDFPVDHSASSLGKGSVGGGKVLGLLTPGTHRLFPLYSGLSSDTLGKTKLRNAPDQTRNCTLALHASRGGRLLGNCPQSPRAFPPRCLPCEARFLHAACHVRRRPSFLEDARPRLKKKLPTTFLCLLRNTPREGGHQVSLQTSNWIHLGKGSECSVKPYWMFEVLLYDLR
uniref:uncharacterized protein LOC113194321 n=1 Tax=Urocitellus parryii TaxID=9999 RepID=UPI000E56054B|nr:uncharacterized protein LOC113194321 [Urocitellus parryii]